VTESLLDGERVSSLGDRERGRGVPELVEDETVERPAVEAGVGPCLPF